MEIIISICPKTILMDIYSIIIFIIESVVKLIHALSIIKSLMEECFIIMVIDYTFSLFFYIHLQNIYN